MNYTRREREEMAGIPVSVYEEATQLRERAEAVELQLANALNAQRSAEKGLEEMRKALAELLELHKWLRENAGRMPDERADAFRIAAGSSHWDLAYAFWQPETEDRERTDSELRARFPWPLLPHCVVLPLDPSIVKALGEAAAKGGRPDLREILNEGLRLAEDKGDDR